MEPTTMILSGITVAVVSGAIVKVFGNNKVKEGICEERRESCNLLLSEKIDNVAKDVREIKDAVNKNV